MQNNHRKYYLRFILELLALFFIAWWAKSLADGFMGVAVSVLITLAVATLWGVFNVPGDESRSGKAPVVVSGKIRLLIEALVFLSATFAAFKKIGTFIAALYLLTILAHYFQTKHRVKWLLKN